MRIRRIIVAGLLGCLMAGSTRGQSSIDSTLHTVESLYTSGSYSLAELEARRFLENDLLSDSLRVVAEQWVAFSLVAQGKPGLAKDHFTEILRRRPTHELDPVLTSPKILMVFNDARTAFRAEQLARRDTSAFQKPVDAGSITFRTIVFPGWEQWHDGRTTTGALFGGAGIVTLGGGIVFEFLRSAARKEYMAATDPDDIASKYQTYNRYAKAEVYAFAAFAVVYLVSEIDVFLTHTPISVTASATHLPLGERSVALSFTLR